MKISILTTLTRINECIYNYASFLTFNWVRSYLDESNLISKKTLPSMNGLEWFEEEIERASNKLFMNIKKSKRSIWIQLLLANKNTIILVIFLKILNLLTSSIVSFLLSEYFRVSGSMKSIKLGCYVIFAYILKLITESQSRYYSANLGIIIESSLIKLAYHRILNIMENDTIIRSNNSNYILPKGKNLNTLNIILADCASCPNFLISSLDILVLPIRVLFTWILLKQQVGSAVTIAIFTFLLMFIFSFIFQILGVLMKAPFMKYRDRRLERSHEVLRQVSLVQLLDLNKIEYNKILELRRREVFYNGLRVIISQIGSFLDYHTESVTQLVLFLNYIYKVIPTSNNSNLSLKSFSPKGIVILQILYSMISIRGLLSLLIDGFISMKRFQSFLNETDNSQNKGDKYESLSNTLSFEARSIYSIFNSLPYSHIDEVLVNAQNVSLFRDSVENFPPIINNINLEIYKGNKVFILGDSGSGKTTFIHAILNTCRVTLTGNIFVYHLKYKLPIGYVSQNPWIPSGTIRSIIIFGVPYNARQYFRVVECCKLSTDFSQWADGDMKVIDEGGNTLSGGQKARICLARVLYSFLDCIEIWENNKGELKDYLGSEELSSLKFSAPLLFILDDIFSSLDPIISRDIFENLFGTNGLLKNSTVITTLDPEILSNSFKNILEGLNVTLNKDIYNNLNSDKNNSEYIFYRLENRGFHKIYNIKTIFNLNNKIIKNHSIQLEDKYSTNLISQSNTSILENSTNSCVPENLNLNTWNNLEIKSKRISSMVDKVTIKGYVSRSSYKWYLNNIGYIFTIIIFLLAIFKSAITKFSDYLLSQYPQNPILLETHLFTYTIVSIVGLIVSGLLYIMEAFGGLYIAHKIHLKLLRSAFEGPTELFPLSNTLSRLGGDLLVVDTCIIKSIITALLPGLEICTKLTIIIYKFPYFLLIAFIWIYYVLTPICLKFIVSYREYQRFALSTSSTLCGYFSSTQAGSITISMLCKENYLMSKATECMYDLAKLHLIQLGASQWAGFWLNIFLTPFGILLNISLLLIIKIYLVLMGYLIIQEDTDTLGSKSGLVLLCIMYSMTIAESISAFMYKFVQMEKEMCSVERIYNYICTKQNTRKFLKKLASNSSEQGQIPNYHYKYPEIEPLLEINDKFRDIPNKGLFINNITVFYTKKSENYELDQDNCTSLLSDLPILRITGNLTVYPGNIVGIIGRTGSGKSTLFNAIMGVVPFIQGYIYLDGKLLQKRNSKNIGILPQTNIIFKGTTIRSLLDPFGEYPDSSIWTALNICQLDVLIENLTHGLDTVIVLESDCINRSRVTKEEYQFSSSQIKYLSFIRILLNCHKYKVILIDEPPLTVKFTVNSNSQISVGIESLIIQCFKHCSVLIITHNPKVLDSCNTIWFFKKESLEVIPKKKDNYLEVWDKL
ncbi:ABC transporter family protein [Cryptosporidium andersoni]|uniref:ABC transporter family protein n=1 Tax=Cryptosporidium andersoni TaxID=117008 RepID=A0A1J4MNX0_9CRYT|nr:ABC transporter family protein [Cryptosporidium andersoni]